MDLETGEIKYFTDEEYKQKMDDGTAKNLLKLLGKPKANCNRCHGRGHIGKSVGPNGDNLYIPCRCVIKR